MLGNIRFFLGFAYAPHWLTATILQLGPTNAWRGLTYTATVLDEPIHMGLETAVVDVCIIFSGAASPGQTNPMGHVDQGGGRNSVALVAGASEISSDE